MLFSARVNSKKKARRNTAKIKKMLFSARVNSKKKTRRNTAKIKKMLFSARVNSKKKARRNTAKIKKIKKIKSSKYKGFRGENVKDQKTVDIFKRIKMFSQPFYSNSTKNNCCSNF